MASCHRNRVSVPLRLWTLRQRSVELELDLRGSERPVEACILPRRKLALPAIGGRNRQDGYRAMSRPERWTSPDGPTVLAVSYGDWTFWSSTQISTAERIRSLPGRGTTYTAGGRVLALHRSIRPDDCRTWSRGGKSLSSRDTGSGHVHTSRHGRRIGVMPESIRALSPDGKILALIARQHRASAVRCRRVVSPRVDALPLARGSN